MPQNLPRAPLTKNITGGKPRKIKEKHSQIWKYLKYFKYTIEEHTYTVNNSHYRFSEKHT